MKIGVILLIICTLLILSIGFVSADVLNVCPACNYTSIQSAINNASAGDTINVAAGTYPENINVNKPVTLRGASSSSVIVSALSPSTSVFMVTANSVDISGFTVSGANVATTAGIYLSDNVSFCNIHDNILTGNGDGIWLGSGSNHNTLRSNTLSSNYQGFEVYISNYNTFTNNIANSNTKYGFKIDSGDHNTFVGNTANSNGDKGFYSVAGDGGGSTNAVFTNNTANSNTRHGIHLIGLNHNTLLKGNTFNANIQTGIKLQDDVADLTLKNNSITNNPIGINIDASVGNVTSWNVNYNNIVGNTVGISNNGVGMLNAQNNWWGNCNPNFAVIIMGDVDYTPWLGACIKNKATSESCVIASDSVVLYANVSSLVCVGDVIFSVNKNGTWQNFTGSVSSSGIGNYEYAVSGLAGGTTVYWTVYADDCYGHLTKNGNENFYVNKRTNVAISSTLGLNNWYITMPLFTLTNPDTTQIFYRWDGTGTHNYTTPFNLTDIPNLPPELAGILKLTWWSNLVCSRTEPEQNRMYYIDLTKPVIESSSPANGANVACSSRPTISAIVSDVYGSNSGVDDNSLIMKVDSINRTITKQVLNDVKTRISYVPTSDLIAGIHVVQISGQDNAGNLFNDIFSFTISPGAGFELSVVAPINKPRESPYGNKQIQLSISTTNRVAKIEYSDNNGAWKNLCTNCNSTNKKLSFSDGQHNLTIRASDACGNQKNMTIAFFIDSKTPRISSIIPTNNKVVNGSRFYIKYSEDNLKNITLYYGNQSKPLVNCLSGNNKNCSTSADLSGYDGQYMNYYFVVSDYLRNVSSKTNRIKVDTSTPILNVYSPKNANYTRRVQFNITLSEKAKLEYYDNSALMPPRWTSLCSNCDKYQNTKSFSAGVHNIQIRATDKAGNSAQETRVFNVA